jgi:hypothetical protein
VIKIRADESSIDEMGANQLNATVGAPERARRQVWDVQVFATVGRPVEDDL